MQDLKNHIYTKLFNNFNQDFSPKEITYDGNINIPHIYFGRSTCSIIAGIDETISAIKNHLEETNTKVKFVEVACIGLCCYDPVIDIQIPGRCRLSLKNVTKHNVIVLIDSVLNNILPEEKFILGQYMNPELSEWGKVSDIFDHHFFKNQNRQLLKHVGFIEPNSLQSYVNFSGYVAFAKTIMKKTSEEVCNIISNSELRGRGGGAFLTGEKWRKVLKNYSDIKYFICNADESDPGSFGDRALIESNPHKLIEGIMIGCYATNTSKAIIYIRNTYKLAIERLKEAIKQVQDAGMLGEDIVGSGFSLNISIAVGPGAYVCGEETALISSLEGERGIPSPKPPYPSDIGLLGKPTVVNNVETLYNIPQIILNGVDWFKKNGNENSYGTKVLSLSGKVDLLGLIEIDFGKTYNEILKIGLFSDTGFKTKAVHIGGPAGGFIHPDNFNDIIDFLHIKDKKLWLGSGSFLVLDQNNCIVDTTKYFIDFIHNESCGKCIPCREGSQRLIEILTRITRRPDSGQKHESLLRFKGVLQMEDISNIMKETSLCGLGSNAANTIFSAVKYFRDEFEEHIFEKKCNANVCKNLRVFTINIQNCVGCGLCAKKCPADAIIGSLKNTHFIVQKRCIKCGECDSACKFNAINIL